MHEEGSGRTRQIRCWTLDMTNGKMAEYTKDEMAKCTQRAAQAQFDEGPNYAPTISVTASDDEMIKIITQQVDLNVAELLGICQLKWGNDHIKRDLSGVLTQLNNVSATFVP